MRDWSQVPDDLVEALREQLHSSEPNPRERLRRRYNRDPGQFVRESWPVLRDHWLASDDLARRAVIADLKQRRLGNHTARPRSLTGDLRYLNSCNVSRSLVAIVRRRFEEAYEAPAMQPEHETDVADWYRHTAFRILRRVEHATDRRTPRPHQKAAWKKLSASRPLIGGLLVFPTGAGKTFTTVSWLVDNVVIEGRPILWIAHRADLLQQAADEFERCASVRQGLDDEPRLRIISSAHGKPVSTLVAPAEIILVTIQSLARAMDRVETYFERNSDAFVVIDEAHHAAARTYRRVIERARSQRKTELLGLSATPTRTNREEIPRLRSLFPQWAVHSVSQRDLIRDGFLSRPVIEEVTTGVDLELEFTDDDKKYFRQFGDLSPRSLDRVARHSLRNDLIVRRYTEFRENYGKTLVFAASINHCVTLADRYEEEGVRVGFVASARPRNSGTNEATLRSFKNGELDVLISVAMLTEGVDLPQTETVFLARPTASPILLRQMIGRGMRGPEAGGSAHVRLVSFHDLWTEFPDWLSPVQAFDEPLVAEDPSEPPRTYAQMGMPWEVIHRIGRLTSNLSLMPTQPVYGWYDLTQPDDVYSRAIPVWEHQVDGFSRYIEDLSNGVFARQPNRRYFDDTEDPRPSPSDLRAMREYVRETELEPLLSGIEQLKEVDPRHVADRIIDLPAERQRTAVREVYDEHPVIARQYQPDEYWRQVREALDRVTDPHPPREDRPPPNVNLTTPPRRPLAPGNHSLTDITDEAWAQLPIATASSQPPPVRWSHRPMRYWAFHRTGTDPGPHHEGCEVVVNRVLQSTDLKHVTLVFLLHHELLHHVLGNGEGHSSWFRTLEKRFPGYQDADADLDTLEERFTIPSARRR